MPRLRGQHRRHAFTDIHIEQVRKGTCCEWWGCGVVFRVREPMPEHKAEQVRAEMRACWRAHRATIMQRHREAAGGESMPWGWWRFESPVKRDRSMSEVDQLRAMGVICNS